MNQQTRLASNMMNAIATLYFKINIDNFKELSQNPHYIAHNHTSRTCRLAVDLIMAI